MGVTRMGSPSEGVSMSRRFLVPRQSSQAPGVSPAISGGIVAAVCLLVVAFVAYNALRKRRLLGQQPRFLPKFLISYWDKWSPGGKYATVHGRDLSSTITAYEPNQTRGTQAAAVDRHTSVRSVITLPAYTTAPKDGEEVIGREGERAGMDSVLEYPETQEEEESRREEQMESLYQIRAARRHEIAEREERRQQRREARERGDTQRLRELRRQAEQPSNESTGSLNAGMAVSAAMLIAEHQSRGRERRVSSVAYGSLGEVRHDGSRLRANSNDSERGGLLAGAESMGQTPGRARQYSDATSLSTMSRAQTRERSISDLSVSTNGDSDLEPQITPTSTVPEYRARPTSSQSEDPQSGTSNSSPTANRFTPDESTGSEDIGESRIPHANAEDVHQPPQYTALEWGDAPSYDVTVAHRAAGNASGARQSPGQSPNSAPRIPELRLPSINISTASEPNTPVIPENNHESR